MVGLPDQLRSGGQTGGDQGGLRAGLTLGFKPGVTLGGWVPKGWKTERGRSEWLRATFGCKEHTSPSYSPRTRANIRAADQTLIFGEVRSPGGMLAVDTCRAEGKPYWVNPSMETLRKLAWGVVNVAGNRESGNHGLEDYVYYTLVGAWWETAVRIGQMVPPQVPVPGPRPPQYLSPEDQWSPLEMSR